MTTSRYGSLHRRATQFGLGLILIVIAACHQDQAQVMTATQQATALPIGPVPGMNVAPPGSQSPYHDNRSALAEGRRLFVQFNCSGCHGGRAGGGMGPSLRDEDWLYGNSDERIYNSIAQGRGRGMPAWGTRIPSDEIWKLTAYVKSLRGPMEPDRPEAR